MALASMTGFARAQGAVGSLTWVWEIRSVNAKGLDLRLRLPPGFDAVEPLARAAAAERLQRGTVYATLTTSRSGSAPAVKVNDAALDAVVRALEVLRHKVDAAPPTLDGLMAIKGVVEVVEVEPGEDERSAEAEAVTTGFVAAVEALVAMRRQEGEALGRLLGERMDQVARLVAAADACPGRGPEAVKARLGEQIRALLEASQSFDPDRLHQEAVLLAAKADVREELDRLAAHVEASRALLAKGGAVGRRLDFLAQEFGRESNTLCAKSNDRDLTAIGLELKSVVEQFREQVQNLE